ncbi:Uncharacterised protein [Yersinia enterocolitica]|nr:Uncharacterised protein [Yersinia enterocolitica]
MCFERANYKELTGLMPVLTPAPLTKQGGGYTVILQAACALAILNNPNHLLVLTLRNSMLIGINEAHPEASPCGQHKCYSNLSGTDLYLVCRLPVTRII